MPLLNGVWLVNDDGETHQVPNNEIVINYFVGRGWHKTDLPSTLDSDDEEFQKRLAQLKADEVEQQESSISEAAPAPKEEGKK